jgi:hypothetical protein
MNQQNKLFIERELSTQITSKHLSSVEEILNTVFAATTLRAGIIVGSGSARLKYPI